MSRRHFMNIFKKLLKKLSPDKPQELECWYNNFHEKKKSRFDFIPESADVGAPGCPEVSCAKSIAQQQT